MTGRRRALIALVFGFVLLGMPGAALGVAWPTMAEQLARSLGDLGVLTLVNGVAYGITSLSSGRITQRFRAGIVLTAATVAGAASLAIFSGAGSFAWLVLASLPLGLAGGAVDSIGNGYVAVHHGARPMGAIHAAFGLGSMVAPLLMTAIDAAGGSWRIGFVVLAVAELAVGLGFWMNRGSFRMPMEGRRDRPDRVGSLRLLGLSVAAFFLYTSVEVSTGFWAFTLLSEGRGLNATVAGVAVAAHWGALFASRLLLGVVGDRMAPNFTITASAVLMVAGLGLLWWYPSSFVAVAGLILSGFASGPVFPLETMLTTRRFGADYTPWAVGYQLGAATGAAATVPAGIGLLVNLTGPLVIAPALLTVAVLTLVCVEVLRLASARDVAAQPGSSAY